MLRQRGTGFGFGGGGGLPTTASSKIEDGSGKSIKMEAPLAKAIRSADGFIKGTYIWLFVSIFFIWGGWTWIRRSSASIVLDCKAEGCTLTFQPPYSFLPRDSDSGIPIKRKSRSKRKTKIDIKRDQLVRADNILWDPNSQEIVQNYGLNSPSYASQQQNDNDDEVEDEGQDEGIPNKRPNKKWNKRNKKKRKKYKKKRNAATYKNGRPDADGNYDSYVIILRDPLPPSIEGEEEEDPDESPSMRMARQMEMQHHHMAHDPNSLASVIAPFAVKDSDIASTEYIVHLRDFNLGQTRRLARTAVSKINAYAKGRRATCILRESRPFWEEYDPTKVGPYRKRMAELRKREEARKARQRKNYSRRGFEQPAKDAPTPSTSDDIYSMPPLYDLAFGYRSFEEEVDFLLDVHNSSMQSSTDEPLRILELAAGPARHSLAALSEYPPSEVESVVALDTSQAMVEYGLQNADHELGTPGGRRDDFNYVLGDMRNVGEHTEASIDTAWILLGSLAHMLTNDDVIQCFTSIGAVLKAGGTVVVELPHPRETFTVGECTRNGWEVPLVEEDKNGEEKEYGELKIVWGDEDDDFDPVAQVRQFTVEMELKVNDANDLPDTASFPQMANGTTSLKEVVPMRLFTLQEMEALARCAGLEMVATYGALDDVPIEDEQEAFRMVCVLRKAAP
ncbi:hypothetical protein ACHAXT_011515 [Thalassiosira profunda]